MIFLKFLKHVVTDANAWMGFYLGADVFFLLGLYWHTFSLDTRWIITGITWFVVLLSAFIIQKPNLQKTDKYKC